MGKTKKTQAKVDKPVLEKRDVMSYSTSRNPGIKEISKEGLPFEKVSQAPAVIEANKKLQELKAEYRRLDNAFAWVGDSLTYRSEFKNDTEIASAVLSGELDLNDSKRLSEIKGKRLSTLQKMHILRKAIELQELKAEQAHLAASRELAKYFEDDIKEAFEGLIDGCEMFYEALNNILRTIRHLTRYRGIEARSFDARWHLPLFFEGMINPDGNGKFRATIDLLRQNWYRENSPLLMYKVDENGQRVIG